MSDMNAVERRWCKALLWWTPGRKALPVLPLRGVLVLLAFLAALAAVAMLVDRLLEHLATEARTSTPAWERENARITHENYAKITNSLADPIVRSPGFTPPALLPGRRRILVIGDSFIWGDGLANLNLTWWRQLQWELERRGWQDVDVIAAGVNGASTQDQYAWLTDPALLERTRPDLIVVGYVTNDAQMRDAERRDLVKVYAPPPAAPRPTVIDALFPNLEYTLRTRAQNKIRFVPDDRTGYPYAEWELKLLEGENFRQYRALLGRFAELAGTLPAPLFFVPTVNLGGGEALDARLKPVVQAFADAGLTFFDLLPAMRACCLNATYLNAPLSNPANGHPGPVMTLLFAQQIATLIETHHPEVLGEKTAPVLHSPRINDWMPAALTLRGEAAGGWQFDYPADDAALLRMPMHEPYVSLHFERPVALRGVALEVEAARAFTVWAMVLGDGDHELPDPVLIGRGRGTQVEFALPQALVGRRITALRIASPPRDVPYEVAAEIAAGMVRADSGKAWFAPLPALARSADDMEHAARSPWLLLENGTPIGQPHALHDHIRAEGGGLYSHWRDGLVFSTPDGSDPRSNGRHYALGRAGRDPVTLRVSFDTPAVRL